jgi:hypothetical protein
MRRITFVLDYHLTDDHSFTPSSRLRIEGVKEGVKEGGRAGKP